MLAQLLAHLWPTSLHPPHTVSHTSRAVEPTRWVHHSKMDGADLPSPSSSTAGAGARRPEGAGEGSGADGERAASPPERCEALAASIAGVLGGELREHEARAAATARSQDEVAAAVDRLNGGRGSPCRSLSRLPRLLARSLLLLLLLLRSAGHVVGVLWARGLGF